jgi:hypothetical protein
MLNDVDVRIWGVADVETRLVIGVILPAYANAVTTGRNGKAKIGRRCGYYWWWGFFRERLY